MTAFPKSRPKALDKKDRQRGEDKLYRDSRQQAMKRDRRHCRICGSRMLLETHHLKPRSGFGVKKLASKHAPQNLITVCGGPNGCHGQITGHVLKLVYGELGADGPVEVLRWQDATKEYMTAIAAA